MSQDRPYSRDVAVIGGCGHVGLPLAITFADVGLRTMIYDVNESAVAQVRRGEMPFAEHGARELLPAVLEKGLLEVHSSPELLRECRFLVMIIGTPIDEHLNPSFSRIHRALGSCSKYLRDGQILILRSTVFPGMSQFVQRYFQEQGLAISVAFCPERVAQGYSLREFRQLPQIISAFDPETLRRVGELFGRFVPELIEMQPTEAELAKLMTNAWRYIQFAIVNQFYMIATKHDLDFERILFGCRHNYPRMAGMPGPGLTAGPCLVKDTMQLAAFSQNTFVLGHAAMLVNEGLPAHMIELAKREVGPLHDKTVGILGMAFKGESDDPRDSLSYKLRKLLLMEARQVLLTDPYVSDPHLIPLDQVLDQAEVLFLATPHKAYHNLAVPPGRVLVDIWNVTNPRKFRSRVIRPTKEELP
jgi:UDP-N-acetyl-D-mannosaminuronic acid dehydrogenase